MGFWKKLHKFILMFADDDYSEIENDSDFDEDVTFDKDTLFTKLVGVSFNDRQNNLKKSKKNDSVLIVHKPTKQFPDSTIVLNKGKDIGVIPANIAKQLLEIHNKHFSLEGYIYKIYGGNSNENKPNLGCAIVIELE